MYSATVQDNQKDKVLIIKLFGRDDKLTYRQILQLWRDDEIFRSFYIDFVKTVDYEAYRWETPCVSNSTIDSIFECVFVSNPSLDRPANLSAFVNQFQDLDPQTQVISFPNLGGDATLIVPTKQTDTSAYSHLRTFTRDAPTLQQHTVWQEVGRLMLENMSDKNIWLNTAGGGVPWLHIRLDSRPKYYWYAPYKQAR